MEAFTPMQKNVIKHALTSLLKTYHYIIGKRLRGKEKVHEHVSLGSISVRGDDRITFVTLYFQIHKSVRLNCNRFPII
jgi:hypothetical protein